MRGLVERAGRLFDEGDVFKFRQADDRLRLDILAGAAGDVVDALRQPGFFGEHFEVLVETLLGRLVVIRGDLQGGVGAALSRQTW